MGMGNVVDTPLLLSIPCWLTIGAVVQTPILSPTLSLQPCLALWAQ